MGVCGCWESSVMAEKLMDCSFLAEGDAGGVVLRTGCSNAMAKAWGPPSANGT